MDGAHLSVLVQEAVALVALRNTGAGWSLSPKVADLWVGGTPGRVAEHQFGPTNQEPHNFGCVALLLLTSSWYLCGTDVKEKLKQVQHSRLLKQTVVAGDLHFFLLQLAESSSTAEQNPFTV